MPGLVLYVSYDGLLEPLGQSQVLPYVRGLARAGHRILLLTFEKPTVLAYMPPLQHTLAAEGIHWHGLRYHKRPAGLSTAWDVLRGVVVALRHARRTPIALVHARSYVAGVVGAVVARITGAKFLFDLRGMWPEERVEGGLWPVNGVLFQLAKRAERWLIRRSDAVVVLTSRHRHRLILDSTLRPLVLVHAIPTGVDGGRFARPNVHERRPGRPRTLIYAGSLGTRYRLDAMLHFFHLAHLADPDLRFVILTRDPTPWVIRDGVTVWAVTPAEVPDELANAWAGICFVAPAADRGEPLEAGESIGSNLGVCPTKVGEYLAAGLPVIVNARVGDLDALILRHRVGVVAGAMAVEPYRRAWDELVALAEDPDLRARCRRVAREHLGLEQGVERYRMLYAELVRGE